LKLLLDTNVLIWWLSGSPRLSSAHRLLIEDGSNAVFVSAVGVAEIAIKSATGKLRLRDDIIGVATAEEGFDELDFRAEHGDELARLPMIHKDPFDRMLIAQALVEDCVLVTSDPMIRQYAVPTV